MSAIWMLGAIAVAFSIARDMSRLMVNRVGLSRAEWIALALLFGPLTGLLYLYRRAVIWRRLIASVWLVVGDASVETSQRRARLDSLRDGGLISQAVYDACLQQLNQN